MTLIPTNIEPLDVICKSLYVCEYKIRLHVLFIIIFFFRIQGRFDSQTTRPLESNGDTKFIFDNRSFGKLVVKFQMGEENQSLNSRYYDETNVIESM